MIIAGTIRNSVSLASLESKWQQKKQGISKGNKENLTAEERELQRFQEQADNIRESKKSTDIDTKLQAGGELTAEENVLLNGTLMGYSESFMKEHFEEIIDFAQLQGFLDMPIKNYSSGMAARLGFSVATVVQPDILICDEVLSVGDYRFQEKCEERMGHMLEAGTTLLYVSHSNESVKKLCSHALWLENGRPVMSGAAEEVCAAYMGE